MKQNPGRHFSWCLTFLMLLFIPISPAVADTPTVAPKVATPSIYDEIRAGRPGSLEKWQVQQMKSMLSAGIRAYQAQTGVSPATVDDLLLAGMLPFRPMLSPEHEYVIVALTGADLPPPNAIGIRLRPIDCRLIRLGADGDPMAPIVEEISAYSGQKGWPVEYPWQARQATLLEAQLVRMLGAYASLTGALPPNPDDFLTALQLMPVGVQWQSSDSETHDGVQIEIDSTAQYVRTTRTPDPGYGRTTTYALQLNTSGTSYSLAAQAWLPTQPLHWQRFGALALTAELPASLAHWSTPPLPEPPAPLPEGHFDSRWWPDRTGIVLDEFVWTVNNHVRRLGVLPTAEWLVAECQPLHRMLDSSNQALPVIASDASDWFSRNQRPPEEPISGVLIGCGIVEMYDGIKQPMVSIQAPPNSKPVSDAFPYGTGGGTSGTSVSLPSGLPTTSGTRNRERLMPDPTLPDRARRWLEGQPNAESDSVYDWLWSVEETVLDSYEHRYAAHAASVLARCYGEWRRPQTTPIHPESWDWMLDSLGLERADYLVLPAPVLPTLPFATCEFALDSLGRYLKVTTTLPNGDRLSEYMRAAYDAGEYPNYSYFVPPKSSPEVAAMEYEPFISFAIPIPEPPLLPEETTP